MAENVAPEEYGHKAIEEDIERLSHVVSVVKEQPASKDVSGHEVVRQSLRVFASSTQKPPLQSVGPLPDYVKDVSPEIRLEIERLVDLAFHQGILTATEAAAAHGQFVVDAFHDTLAGKLYPELQKRGII
jgi:hypothetical protein